MRCPVCSAENREERRFCHACGAPLLILCPECGFLNHPGERFCGGCGIILSAGVPGVIHQQPSPGPETPPSLPGIHSSFPTPSASKTLEPERRQLTIMFCDLVESTTLSQRLDPEDLRTVIRAYRQVCNAVIRQYEGLTARYAGDGILAYFGYPQAHEDDAERGIRAGLKVVEAVAGLKVTLDLEEVSGLAVRVGIATGLVVAGDLVGDGTAEQKTAVGETPNLAARLQSLAKPNAVVIGSSTRCLVRGLFEYEDLGSHRLKGFAEPMQVWRVIRPRETEIRFEAMYSANLVPLVGREHEIGILLERWERARQGDGQVVLLSGEPGIGKSRIAQTLVGRLADESQLKMCYQCSPYHVNSALYPIIHQIEQAAGFERSDTAAQKLNKLETLLADLPGRIEEVAPLFANLLSIPTGDRYPYLNLTPQQEKAKILLALVTKIEKLATYEPVLVIFEDAHWIDPTSQELLDLAIERIKGTQVLLIITFRPDFVTPWSHRPYMTSLSLTRLNATESKTLAAGVAEGKTLPDNVLEQIVTKTDGIPLFIEELTKTVLGSEVISNAVGHSAPLTLPVIPATLQDSLMARLDQLAPVKNVAQIGAVIGREFSYELLAKISMLPEEQLQDALEQLTQAQLILQEGPSHEAVYTFRHALLQDAAYESLLKSRRQQFHARIAHVLERRLRNCAEGAPELVAHHYTRAGAIEQAVTYWLLAGQRAAERSAFAEACAHLNKGLELLPRLPETPDRYHRELALQITLGDAYTYSKGYAAPETEHAYTRALALCRQLDDPPQLFPVLCGVAAFHLMRAELGRSRIVAEDLLGRAAQQTDQRPFIMGHRLLGNALLLMGELEDARHHLGQAVDLYDADKTRYRELPLVNASDEKASALSFLSLTLLFLGYPDQGLKAGRNALQHSEDLGHLHSIAFSRAFLDGLYLIRREHHIVRERAEKTMAFSIERGFPNWLAISRIHRGSARVEQGDIAAGLAEIRQGVTEFAMPGFKAFLPLALFFLAKALGQAQQDEEALGVLASALAAVEETGERWYEAELHRLKGEIMLQTKNEVEAEACFHHSIELARQQRALFWELRTGLSLSRLWQHQGKSAAACNLLAPICEWFTEGFDTIDLQDAKNLLKRLNSTTRVEVKRQFT